SYANSSATNVIHTQGYHTGNGYIIITYSTQYCASQRVPVQINVSNITPPVINSPVTAYCGGSAALTPIGSTGNFVWYDAPTGGNYLGFGSSFTPVLNGSGNPETLYVAGTTTSIAPGSTYEFGYTGGAQTWTVPAGVT